MTDLTELIATATDSNGSSFGRRMAVSDLGKSDDDRAFQTLAALLTDEDQYLRREVVAALARKRDQRTVEPLIEALGDADDYIQRDAAAALGKLGDVRAVEPLEMLSQDDSYSVRDAAKRALEAIEKEPRTPPQPPPAPAVQTEPESPAVKVETASPADEEPDETAIPAETAPAELEKEPARLEPAGEDAVPDVGQDNDEIGDEEVAFDHIDSVSMADVLESPPSIEIEPAPSPWEQVTEIVTAGPSDVVTAEIVAEPSTPLAAKVEPLPTDALLHRIPKGFSWEAARRMHAFFGDQLADVQQAYERLHEQQKRLLVGEREHHQIVQQLSFRRADKDDDLCRCEEDIDAAREELQRLKQSASRARRDLNRLKTEANSIGHHVTTMIWPDKAKKHQQMRSEVEAALRKLEQRIAATRNRISELEEQHAQLAEPRKRLQAAAETTAADRDAAAEAAREANGMIEERITATIRHLPRDELDARLKQLGALSADGAYYHACVSELLAALGELDGTVAQLEKANAEAKDAVDMARQATDALGSAIASGFAVASIEKQTPVRLHGSLHFKEDRSFFGGYSGASGSASGSGSGEALYSVDEIEWRPPAEFQQRVAGFADSWASCGERTAQREMLSVAAEADRSIVAEYVHFIRMELERDFIELHAEG